MNFSQEISNKTFIPWEELKRIKYKNAYSINS